MQERGTRVVAEQPQGCIGLLEGGERNGRADERCGVQRDNGQFCGGGGYGCDGGEMTGVQEK